MLVVTYHAIGTPASRVVAPLRRFEGDLSSLIDAGYVLISLDACADWLEGRVVLPSRTAAVTFDDGYASVAEAALPVLQRLRVPATVFVVGGRLGLDNRWPSQPAWVPHLPLLDTYMLRDLVAAGVAIGSHSWSHPRLPALDDHALMMRSSGLPTAWNSWPTFPCATSRIPTASTAGARWPGHDRVSARRSPLCVGPSIATPTPTRSGASTRTTCMSPRG